ncbi:unnamed protein product [Candidula unifasciata]|uniref:Poly [ADP-ribose] polymerase n=1 Tax=Candidula unifasciata TaxID=100452 RepID=A0A8S3ZPL7_9EUPU|nr:unnamed protein product [Candidula unifasciata]
MIHSTFDPCRVGRGRDAEDLDHCDISVNDIQRVKNRQIFREYCDFRDELRDKTCDGDNVEKIEDFPQKVWSFKKSRRHVDLNEIYLFHGTSEDSANQIIEEGFDTGITNPRNLYGRGIYFAEEFTKADQYTDDRDDRDPHGTELTLLLCKVLMGNAFMCGKYDAEKWKQPPCMKCGRSKCRHGWQHRYDSVLGSGHGMLFREFVVYDGRQCFPEFIIKYERLGGWEPLYEYDE